MGLSATIVCAHAQKTFTVTVLKKIQTHVCTHKELLVIPCECSAGNVLQNAYVLPLPDQLNFYLPDLLFNMLI